MNILIIDDDELDRLAILRSFRESDVEINVTQADTGRKGVMLAKEQQFDVVLLDFNLPDIDGLEVLEALKSPSASDVTVIMLSGEEKPLLARLAIDSGAQDFIPKSEISASRLTRAMLQAQHRHDLEQQLKYNQAKLKKLAESDPLTGLSNRYDFERALQLAADRSVRGGHIALLMLDIDRFKQVNDKFGHAAGDKLLKEVANRLKKLARQTDLVARLGGDEFVILLNKIERDDQAIILANRIIKNFAKPITLDNTEWVVTTSIGIAVLGDCAPTSVDLLKCADIALYRAKHEGRNQCHFYSNELHESVRRTAELERGVKHALKNNELDVYYQPQIESKTDRLTGIEALLRWNHPTLGVINPDTFLNVVEEAGLLYDIGAWVLEKACYQLKQWKNDDPDLYVNLCVSVNLSAVQLHGDDLIHTVENILSTTQLDPNCLQLELSESILPKGWEGIPKTLNVLAEKGVNLVLDNFGKGCTSFEHLRNFPVNSIKIDKSFIADINKSEKHNAIITGIARLGSTMNLNVIAAGVETQAQADFCKQLDCQILQGFFFSKPVHPDEFAKKYLVHIKN